MEKIEGGVTDVTHQLKYLTLDVFKTNSCFEWNCNMLTLNSIEVKEVNLLHFGAHPQVICFVRRLRSRNSDTGLITADFALACLLLIRKSQAESFSSTVAYLNCNLRTSPQDKLLPYNPVLDDQGILRSAGRLKCASLPESTRLPIILDAKNPLVKLLVQHSHAACRNAGPDYVKALLQRRYLIIGVRSALRSVSHR